MNKESKAYRSGEFDDIFEAAEVSRLEEPEATAYSQSYLADLEHESALRFAAKKGLKEGIGIGREEGKKEGFNSAIAAMIENGATDELIRKFTGITPENLAKIRNSLNHQ